jgi:5-methylcytosine-specific restriction endonuclease McrA
MIDFLQESRYFGSVVFAGNFDIDIEHLSKLFEHYNKTGENLLDEYCTSIYAFWDTEEENLHELICDEEYHKKINAIAKIAPLRLFDIEKIRRTRYILKIRHDNYKRRIENSISEERYEACRFTSREDIREKVFDLHGHKCLNCGATDDIALDHVKPIAKGGENKIDNLQPLCKSCNSSKGIKEVDYR